MKTYKIQNKETLEFLHFVDFNFGVKEKNPAVFENKEQAIEICKNLNEENENKYIVKEVTI